MTKNYICLCILQVLEYILYANLNINNILANTAHVLIDAYNEIQQWEQK